MQDQHYLTVQAGKQHKGQSRHNKQDTIMSLRACACVRVCSVCVCVFELHTHTHTHTHTRARARTHTVKSCIKAAADVQFFNFFDASSFQVRLLFEGELYAKS